MMQTTENHLVAYFLLAILGLVALCELISWLFNRPRCTAVIHADILRALVIPHTGEVRCSRMSGHKGKHRHSEWKSPFATRSYEWEG